MGNLTKDLDLLHQLNALRTRAKELREGGLRALKGIKDIDLNGRIIPINPKEAGFERTLGATGKVSKQGGSKDGRAYEKWITSANDVECALLVKVQNHKDISDSDRENDCAEASRELKERLKNIKLRSLFPDIRKTFEFTNNGKDQKGEYLALKVYRANLDARKRSKTTPNDDVFDSTERFMEGLDITVPVLIAARTMQALVRRAQTVFHRGTMICYYRIVRELYVATGPDWTIGGARANVGGSTSAFVTSECIRAILAFENAVKRTVEFFKHTRQLWQRHNQLKIMLECFGVQPGTPHPLSKWADSAIRRMWLDWYISTNPRRGEMAVYLDASDNQIRTTPLEEINMNFVGRYLEELPKSLGKFVVTASDQMQAAKTEINEFRDEQYPCIGVRGPGQAKKKEFKRGRDKEDERLFQQTESAHQVALRAVERGISETEGSRNVLKTYDGELVGILDEFIIQFEDISRSIHRILEPAKRYVRNVVNREIANANTGRFDAGELAFAVASFGATTGWKPDERLNRACKLLIKSLPDSGSLPTKRPFHSTPRGYRLLPIGCELTRSFAQLLQKTGYEVEPQLVQKMLSIFEDKLREFLPSGNEPRRFGWNFEGAPSPDRPCVWVTAVAVLALDRIVRMLNERINKIVLSHFEVVMPEKPHTELTLNQLIYPDYGFTEYFSRESSLAIRLEQMRAHIIRATLPESYGLESHKRARGRRKQKVFSLILYGPPGTGKTTLAESLALSSGVPLVRLSPSDLTVQGQELIEGRARAVFEALSMLTQAVILLDEFEPVLTSRNPIGEKAISNDPVFRFLVTGMLPKLAKLYEAAERQSLVYCLATNFIEQIDNAARRFGRFDLKIPVYHPDPLSRAGAFLYRLKSYQDACGGRKVNLKKNKTREIRLMEVIADTAYLPAGELAKHYFKPQKDSPWFEYYLRRDAEKCVVGKTEPLKITEWQSEEERVEREWLIGWEGRITNAIENPTGVRDLASHCLTPCNREEM